MYIIIMNVYENAEEHVVNIIKQIESEYKTQYIGYNKNIFYQNIWVYSWEEKIPANFVLLLNYMKEKHIIRDDDRCLSIGIISALPGCNDQPFHFDYLNNTMTVFIPLVDLDDDNGTEYILMQNGNYDDVTNQLMPFNYMTNSYDALKQLVSLDEHVLQRVNSSKYNFVKLNKSVFHRGVKNMKHHEKTMIQLLFSDNPDYVFPFRDRIYSNAVEGSDDM